MSKSHTVQASIAHTIQTSVGSALVFTPDPSDHLQKPWSRGRFYEANTLAHIQRTCSGGIFIDCGSCIGNHTLYFAKFCKPSLVISIEPVQENIQLQEQILELNDLSGKVALLPVALSNRIGTGTMVEELGSPWNVGMWMLREGEDVQVITLDSLFETGALFNMMLHNVTLPDITVGNITLMKLDTQWCEDKVLLGAQRILTEGNPVLIVELASEAMYRKVVPLLAQFDYHLKGEALDVYNYEFRKRSERNTLSWRKER